MKKVYLYSGIFVLVDDFDSVLLEGRCWVWNRGRKCVQAQVWDTKLARMRTVLLHRLIMNAPPGLQVDHINGNQLDNRRCNLRLCTNLQNSYNFQKYKTKQKPTSVYKGVSFDLLSEKWRARINVGGKTIYLGRFTTETEAARVRDLAAIEYHGMFANLNFPQVSKESQISQVG